MDRPQAGPESTPVEPDPDHAGAGNSRRLEPSLRPASRKRIHSRRGGTVIQVICTIAGSDSSAGAGIQADLKSIAACGGYGVSVLTAITAQNTRGVLDVLELPPARIISQLDAIFDDMDVAAVKTGMLASATIVQAVAAALRRRRPRHFVLDPVMRAKSGDALLAPDAATTLRDALLPLATVVTPNLHEAAALSGAPVRDLDDAVAAGRAILERGCGAVLIKGGHLDGSTSTDVLVTPGGVEVFEAPKLAAQHTHGTGCTLSAALATFLGRGLELREAVRRAKLYVTEAIRSGLDIGHGTGPTDHFFYLRRPDTEEWIEALDLRGGKMMGPRIGRLHVLTDEELQQRWTHVDLARMAAAGGAQVVQYRDKRAMSFAQRLAAARALREALPPHVRLVVNDHADVARDAGADGVHLGWDDLPHPEARRILGEKALVGGTANSLEAARRCFELPLDYIGVGPVFGTGSKAKAPPALGLETLARIARESPLPIIAIGGIGPEDVDALLRAGAWGIAVLSGVVLADAPQEATARYVEALERGVSRLSLLESNLRQEGQ